LARAMTFRHPSTSPRSTVYIRERSMTYGLVSGTQLNIGAGTTHIHTYSLGDKVTEDVVGNRLPGGGYGDNYFHMHSYRYTPTRISGKSPFFPVYEYSSYPVAGQPALSHQTLIDSLPSDIELATQSAAQTNPSTPSVSLPVFIGELRELPARLLRKGRNRNPYSKNSSAAGQFGWQPLFSDFFSLLRFTEQVTKRIDTLDHLYNKGGSSAKGKTVSSHGYGQYTDFPFHTLEAYIAGDVNYHTLVERWAVCRWKPTHAGLRSPSDLTAEARRAVHGWRVSPADVWELLPWSWFIDYFGNIGDYLQATDNTIAYNDGPACVMTHSKTEMTLRLTTSNPGFSVSLGSGTLEDKFRALQPIGLTVTAPFLSARQLTNLVGIAANLGIG